MAKSGRRGIFALRVAGVTLALLLVARLFRSVRLDHVLSLLGSIGVGGLLLIAAPQGIASLLECVGWRQVFAVWGQRVGLRPLLRVRIATEALSQTLPLGALWSESLKPALLGRHAEVPTSRGVASVVARKYLQVASQVPYVVLCGWLGASALRRISEHFLGNSWLLGLPWLAAAVLAGLAFGLAGASAKGQLAARAYAALSAIPSARLRASLARKRQQFTRSDSLVEAYFSTPFAVSTLRPGFAVFSAWLCEAVETFLILRLLAVKLDFAAILAIEGSLSFVRNVVFVVPAGLGVQELGYAACLSALGVPDALNASAAFSILKRSKELAWASAGYSLLAWDLRERAPRFSPEPVQKTA
ncbi:MAG TPA: lysylphosphatidylglycerol synthase transmembrane domain-containing protein [Polyangiaceae bacterium]